MLVIALTTSLVSGQTNLEEAKKEIAESNEIYFTAFAKNDSSIFINRYAEDACIKIGRAHV